MQAALKPPTNHSRLPLRLIDVMDILFQKATKRQIASGTAPIHVRVPAKYWFGPDLWPDIAEAAIWKGWSAGGIILHLTATLDCLELGQALQDLERADLDDECNVVAPFVREDSTGTWNGVKVVVLDDSDVDFIDVDDLDVELPSNSESGADLIMNLE